MLKFLIIIFISFFSINNQENIDVNKFYNVFLSNSNEQIDKLLVEYNSIKRTNSIINVYKGALLIKKASLNNIPAKKLEYFKIGKSLIEQEIKTNQKNVEYRFIRLIVQEQSPAMLKYKNNIQEDKKMILLSFKDMEQIYKDRIVDYSKISKFITLSEIKEHEN
ncbi:MAG: hypothetical protein A2X02_00500 [Bacteroidetes bacterium GWF2_29_10]|nr:MAG: hypothetical protein A2X02_00500 [Bacteroidetes bacterium GWF2_29_10]